MKQVVFIVAVIAIATQHGDAQQPASIDQRLSELEKRVSELERRSQSATTPTANAPNLFEAEERKDRYELLKADQKMQENLPQVISFFSDTQSADPSSIQAQTHQKIAKLCEELSTIVPKIIAAKADSSVSSLIGRQREILKSFDAILAAEHTAEMETRLHVSEHAAELIAIDRQYNQKALSTLNQ